MILAEKLSQKLNNLKSKKEIKDFFIFYDEFRKLEIYNRNGQISTNGDPTHYTENSKGKFIIIWDDEFYSHGHLNTTSINSFDEFITLAGKTKIPYTTPIFIPERGIYPMIITYSKSLADMIDIPEYLLKLSDLTYELDKMVGAPKGSSVITVRDGVRHGYSSKALDEYYSYSRFFMSKTIGEELSWTLESSDVFPIVKFQEVFSFLGDLYNILRLSKKKNIEKGKSYDVILSPDIFKKIFSDQILDNINGKKILDGQSCFKPHHFSEKIKCMNTLSVSYDPLINQKTGTYRFSDFGQKPKKQYFIKYGKLDTPVLDNQSYSQFGYEAPTMEFQSFANIKLEGLKKKSFVEAKKGATPTLFAVNVSSCAKVDFITSSLYIESAILYDKATTTKIGNATLNLNLVDLLRTNQVELVEFIDGQLGAKLTNIKL